MLSIVERAFALLVVIFAIIVSVILFTTSSSILDERKNFELTFSIIIPTYNRPVELQRALDSALAQTFNDYEVIVIIDGEITGYEYLAQYANNPKLIVIKNETNQGVARSRNTGIRIAKGRYISFLDDDDEFHKDFLDETYKVLSKTPANVCVSWSYAKIVNYKNDKPAYTHDDVKKLQATSYMESIQKFLTVGTSHGITIKRQCFDCIGLFNELCVAGSDREFFFRLIYDQYLPVLVPKTLVTLHNHNNERLTDDSHMKDRVNTHNIIMRRYIRNSNELPIIKSKLLRSLDMIYASATNDPSAVNNY